ncbi:MAG TPA: nuclease-related domain-containing protein [Solirubrobacterales bacterium]|nr:nuclease-related domain-containing protein [Solirubrobacterales bacterium]
MPFVNEGLDIDFGTAGGSARREHERRRAHREARTRERHPHIGSLMLRFQTPPSHETSWEVGAQGEEALGESLARRSPRSLVLHDRRIPRRRANIDHLAVTRSGVFVIDAKRYKGRIEVRRPLFGDAALFIRGRDKSKLVDGLEGQVEIVRSVLAETGSPAPVRGCFCFLEPAGRSGTQLPLLRTLSIREFPLLRPRRLAKLLNRPGELGEEEMERLATTLAERFPPA